MPASSEASREATAAPIADLSFCAFAVGLRSASAVSFGEWSAVRSLRVRAEQPRELVLLDPWQPGQLGRRGEVPVTGGATNHLSWDYPVPKRTVYETLARQRSETWFTKLRECLITPSHNQCFTS